MSRATGRQLLRMILLATVVELGVTGFGSSRAEAESQRILIEVEDYCDLLYYPFHHLRSPGWYVIEANCRSYGTPWGNGRALAIHETSPQRKVTCRLPVAVGPGKYSLTMGVAGTTMGEKLQRDNVLAVYLGDEVVEFRWRNVGRAFAWLPFQQVTLRQTTQELAIEARQFGGAGVVHLNEAQVPSLWLDSIYLSNLPEEEPLPTPADERQLKFGVSALPLPEVPRRLWYEQFGTELAVQPTPVILEAEETRNNLLPNSSFELGLPARWAATNVDYTYCYLFTDEDLSSQMPYHGQYCLAVPPGARPFSGTYYLPKSGRLTLSGWVRAAKSEAVRLILRKLPDYRPAVVAEGMVGTEWTRLQGTGEVEAGYVDIAVEHAGLLWVDGLQLEYGDGSPFQPCAQVEVGFSTGKFGNVLLEESDDLALQMWCHNDGDQPAQVRVRYSIQDLYEQTVASGITPLLSVPAKATVRTPFYLPFRTRGIFRLQWAAEGRPRLEGELVFVVLPRAVGQTQRHLGAANMDILEHPYRLFRRLGFGWQLYCKFYPTFPERANPMAGAWQWFDQGVRLAERYELKTVACLWPSQPRPHWADGTKIPGQTMGITRNNQRNYSPDRPVYPNLPRFEEYVRAVVGRYKQWIRQWVVEDETELYFTPVDFVPIYRAAQRAIKGADPSLDIGTSYAPQYQEEFLELVDGDVDFMGASSWGAAYWEARKIAALQRRWKKPWYCFGVGLDGQPSFYRTLPQVRPALREAAMAAQELVKLCVVQDARVVGHYTGRIRNFRKHSTSDFPLIDYDGTPLPFGTVYASVLRVLGDAVPAGELWLGAARPEGWRTMAFLFEQQGRLHAVTWSNAPGSLHSHNVLTPTTAGSETVAVRFPKVASHSVEFTDPFLNPWPSVQYGDASLELKLTPMPLFVWNRGLSQTEFRQWLAEGELEQDRVVGHMFLRPTPAGGFD